ncbi:hypothetical protein AAC387_Pa01g1210 [Persea americana]
MGALPAAFEGHYSPQSHHISILKSVLQGSSPAEALICSYKRSFNGFAAKLTYQEQQKIASMQDVVSVFPSKMLQLHTTRSWDFLGFPDTVKRRREIETNVIIGVLDTGIWPESKSFRDKRIGPPPKKWKGSCQTEGNVTCNNKLIGARYYQDPSSFADESTARDFDGHGTHTSSTAAGRAVSGASLYGIAKGKARGAVPLSRIAMYKICWSNGCPESSILAAFDDAIADGVDIISLSLGPNWAANYSSDSIPIGSFHAMQKGILAVQSAGNNGPSFETLGSVAPWLFTVAASNTDRLIISKAVIGNGTAFQGRALNTFASTKMVPLIYGGDASNKCSFDDRRFCYSDCLDRKLVEGKILFCDASSDGQEAINVGAVGSIMEEELMNDLARVYALPATLFGPDGEQIKHYINTTKNPMARILKSESIHDATAPYVVSYSSRGPNHISPDILKPDITAPGIDILAAFSPLAKLTTETDKRSVNYNILSGTSMSCPHVSGAAAYVKSFHKKWSPASIKSALMTTAAHTKKKENPDAEFAYGAGEIDPLKALNPGLVYDTQRDDYLEFLCSEGYSAKEIKLISGDNFKCPKASKRTAKDLNYPSMTFMVQPNTRFSAKFTRRVTNVGSATSTYKAVVAPHPQIKIKVEPSVLSFKSLNQELSFVVTVAGKGLPFNTVVSTSLVWSDGVHSVYIVYMGSLPNMVEGHYSPESHHISILQNVLRGSSAAESLVNSYKRSFNGFAAKLTQQEQQKIASMQGVLSVFPSKNLKLQTTRSWDFLGFPETAKRHLEVESDVIIGLLDTGIWPESKSFEDNNIGPPPKKWKGSCQTDGNFTCNNKLIGARYYKPEFDDEPTVRDYVGHGTHVASIAAGRAVSGASFYGFGKGKARGAVPLSRIAMYKVCWTYDCPDEAVLSAFDDVIADGVDIISISMDYDGAWDYINDVIAIGSFHAMQKGILVVQSAGNGGPRSSSVASVAPWLFTAAASNTDRLIISKVVLGNITALQGFALNTFVSTKTVPLISGEDASNNCSTDYLEWCTSACLDRKLTEGKILLCQDQSDQDLVNAGVVGSIIEQSDNGWTSEFGLPATGVSYDEGEQIRHYIGSTKNPVARILKSETIHDPTAPIVAFFSSRGPNNISPDILKPDITAPGNTILAAFSPAVKLSNVEKDKRSVHYNILSGTSASSPHVSGAAAYVKSFHKDWPPAFIKSALMTTADQMKKSKIPQSEFDYGAGQINPLKALNPGLVYDTRIYDYLEFLCHENYYEDDIRWLSGYTNFSCPYNNRTSRDLNYPTMVYNAPINQPFSSLFSRRVTNVGSAASSYKVKVTPVPGLQIKVEPSVLSFKSLNQELPFVVTVSGQGLQSNTISTATLVWSDGVHKVRSPIIVYTDNY